MLLNFSVSVLSAVCVVVVLLLFAVQPTHAVVIYDEAVSGDLPDIGLGPVLNLVQGPDSEVKGDLVPPADPTDKFQFVVPPGFKIDDIIVEAEPDPADPNGFGFIMLEIEVAPTEPIVPWELVLWSISNPTPPGGTSLAGTPPISLVPSPIEDLLPFIPSVEPYRFKMTVEEDPIWSVTFQTSPIPEPTSLLLLVAGGSWIAVRERRAGMA